MKTVMILSVLFTGLVIGAFLTWMYMGSGRKPNELNSVAPIGNLIIKRSTPNVGYIDPEFFAGINMSQTVRANNTVYFSGIVAGTGNFEPVAVGDISGQVEFILDILGKLLAAENMTYANLVSTTVYTTDIKQLGQHITLFADRFQGNPPTSTWIEVKALYSPEFMLEVAAVAVDN